MTDSPPPTKASPRWVRGDLLPVVCCLVALGVYVVRGFESRLTRDMAVYAYAGQQVAEGVPPYLGILNRAGPLSHLVPGVGVAVARQVGMDDILGIRLLFMLISVACVGLIYIVARDLFGSRVAGIGAAGALLAFEGFAAYASNGPREKTLMVLFLLAALLAVIHQRWGTSGVMISLATLTWQPVFLTAFAGAAVAVALGAQRRTAALVRIIIGGALPALAILFAYALIGEVGKLIDAFLLINARYTHSEGFFERNTSPWPNLFHGLGISLFVAILGLVALLLLGFRALRTKDKADRRQQAARVGCAAALAAGLAWTVVQYNYWPDIFVLLPLAALGIGGLFALLDVPRVPPRVAVAAASAWAVAVTSVAAVAAVQGRSDGLDDERAGVRAVFDVLPAGAEMLVVNSPQPLVLTSRRHPIRLQLYGNGLVDYVDDTWRGGREGLGRWFSARAPAVIAVNRRPPGWLVTAIRGDYTVVGQTDSWLWWVHRRIGARRLAEMTTNLQELEKRADE